MTRDEAQRRNWTFYEAIKAFLCDKLHHIVNLYLMDFILTYDSNERYIIILLS